MNLLDWILLSVAALLAFVGYRKGLISTLFSFVSTWLALFLAWIYHRPLSLWLMQEWSISLPEPWSWLTPWMYRLGVLFLLIFLLRILFRAIGQFLRLVHWIPVLSTADRVLGGTLAIGLFAAVLFFLSPFFSWLPSEEWRNYGENSFWLERLQELPQRWMSQTGADAKDGFSLRT